MNVDFNAAEAMSDMDEFDWDKYDPSKFDSDEPDSDEPDLKQWAEKLKHISKGIKDDNEFPPHADWETRLRAAGVYEREMERQRIIDLGDMFRRYKDEGDEALDYEEWLGISITFPEYNYSSRPLAHLRRLDGWLWEYEPIPSGLSPTSYLFNWDDVVKARANGEITSQKQWERHVDQRYYAEWLKYNVRYLQAELDPYQECKIDKNVPSIDLDDPDKYAYWVDWTDDPNLWKAIARFPADYEPEAITLNTRTLDPSSCIKKGDYGKWYVRIPRDIEGITRRDWEKPESIPLGEWYEKDDALACAIEGIRCFQPNTRFSETELAHQAATMDRRELEMAVAGLIGRWFYTHGRSRFPANVEAILALDALYKHDGQFERDSKGVWQLWCEARYPLRSEFISCAEAIPNEISEALDRTWGKFMSRKLRKGFRNTQAT